MGDGGGCCGCFRAQALQTRGPSQWANSSAAPATAATGTDTRGSFDCFFYSRFCGKPHLLGLTHYVGIVIDIIGSRDHRKTHKLNLGQGVAKQAKFGALRW